MLDRLPFDSRCYQRSEDYKELLGFVARLGDVTPFNAMLLHMQDPDLTYAASARDWLKRYGRTPREGARPLLVLRPSGLAGLVYDLTDTEGRELPKDGIPCRARPTIDADWLRSLGSRRLGPEIELQWVDAGDEGAGPDRGTVRPTRAGTPRRYRIAMTRSHPPAARFAALARALSRVFLGHLGPDKDLDIPARRPMTDAQREGEVLSAVFLLCARNGVSSTSDTCLFACVNACETVEVDLHRLMRATGQVEDLLDLAVSR